MFEITPQKYATAKEDLKRYKRCLQLCRDQQGLLIDKLLEERKQEKMYLNDIACCQEVITLYEQYNK